MQLHIRNMVCPRCITAVKTSLEKTGLHPLSIILGEALIEEEELTPSQTSLLSDDLLLLGFELLSNEDHIIIEKIKSLIIESIHYQSPSPLKLSSVLADQLHLQYTSLSKLFSQHEGITIEQFHINQKIERVKELLLYNELSLSQISMETGYSSSAHLSAQFKKITGVTPTQFKQSVDKERRSLDQISKKI